MKRRGSGSRAGSTSQDAELGGLGSTDGSVLSCGRPGSFCRFFVCTARVARWPRSAWDGWACGPNIRSALGLERISVLQAKSACASMRSPCLQQPSAMSSLSTMTGPSEPVEWGSGQLSTRRRANLDRRWTRRGGAIEVLAKMPCGSPPDEFNLSAILAEKPCSDGRASARRRK